MSNFPSSNYNPYYYGINSSGLASTGFRSLPQNYYAHNLYAIEPDTVYISPENRVNKEKKLSKKQKIILGISAAVTLMFGYIIGHKITNNSVNSVVKENLSGIFRRNLTKEETSTIAKRYKELFKIDNCDEFCKKMYEQVKKDYGYEKLNIPLEIVKADNSELYLQTGSWSAEKGMLRIIPAKPLNANLSMKEKKKIFKTYLHEFQHVKQTELAYRADENAYINALKEHYKKLNSASKVIERAKELLNNRTKLETYARKNGETVEASRKTLERILKSETDNTIQLNIPQFDETSVRNRFKSWFGGMPKIEPGTEEYGLAQKYINDERNYISASVNLKKYKTQTTEAEAYKAAKRGERVLRYLVRA